MIIDCHVHSYIDEELKELVFQMKKNNIKRSVIMYWPWPIFGTHKVPPFEEMLDRLKDHQNLLLAGSMLISDSGNYTKKIAEMESAFQAKKIVGMKICLGYEHLYANDPRADKVYELCAKYNAPVIFHTGDTWNVNPPALVRFADPIYIDDVAQKFPDLKILISHIGNPCWIRETAELLYKNKNIYADFSGTLATGAGKLNKYYDEALKRQILELVAYCENPRKLLFGTDYYVHKQEPYIKFLKSFREFSKEDLEYITHKNAEMLYGL